MLVILAIIAGIFGINTYNEFNYNALLERQKEVVVNYLNETYPDRDFEITEMYETNGGCSMLECHTPVIKNRIIDRTTNQIFQIDVKIDNLSIYHDSFNP